MMRDEQIVEQASDVLELRHRLTEATEKVAAARKEEAAVEKAYNDASKRLRGSIEWNQRGRAVVIGNTTVLIRHEGVTFWDAIPGAKP